MNFISYILIIYIFCLFEPPKNLSLTKSYVIYLWLGRAGMGMPWVYWRFSPGPATELGPFVSVTRTNLWLSHMLSKIYVTFFWQDLPCLHLEVANRWAFVTACIMYESCLIFFKFQSFKVLYYIFLNVGTALLINGIIVVTFWLKS